MSRGVDHLSREPKLSLALFWLPAHSFHQEFRCHLDAPVSRVVTETLGPIISAVQCETLPLLAWSALSI